MKSIVQNEVLKSHNTILLSFFALVLFLKFI